ncbi:MAG: hypothetical protein M1819_003857 [Sarea resinae]|nr:MAG: hypothetical protein M1819_003857 [Sarea resinae]
MFKRSGIKKILYTTTPVITVFVLSGVGYKAHQRHSNYSPTEELQVRRNTAATDLRNIALTGRPRTSSAGSVTSKMGLPMQTETDTRVVSEEEVDMTCLAGKKVVVVGYGDVGRAVGLNLRDTLRATALPLQPKLLVCIPVPFPTHMGDSASLVYTANTEDVEHQTALATTDLQQTASLTPEILIDVDVLIFSAATEPLSRMESVREAETGTALVEYYTHNIRPYLKSSATVVTISSSPSSSTALPRGPGLQFPSPLSLSGERKNHAADLVHLDLSTPSPSPSQHSRNTTESGREISSEDEESEVKIQDLQHRLGIPALRARYIANSGLECRISIPADEIRRAEDGEAPGPGLQIALALARGIGAFRRGGVVTVEEGDG